MTELPNSEHSATRRDHWVAAGTAGRPFFVERALGARIWDVDGREFGDFVGEVGTATHGRTLLTLSLTANVRPYKLRFGPFAPEIYRAPGPYPYRGVTTDDAIAGLQRLFTNQVDPSNVAAIIFEPIQSEGGFIPMPLDYPRMLADIAAEALGEQLRTRLELLAGTTAAIGDVRGLGAMLALEVVSDPGTKEPDPGLAAAVIDRAFDKGLVLMGAGVYSNCIRVLVPLVATETEIEEGMSILAASFEEATQ